MPWLRNDWKNGRQHVRTAEFVSRWIKDWTIKGYTNDIPDEVPVVLMQLGLAPSYKAVALALLRNDMNMEALGYSPKRSEWYGAFKRVEIAARSQDKTKKD